MGKGDKKTKKGKIFSGSYGVTRKKKKAVTFVAKPNTKEAEPKKEEEVPAKEAVKKAPAKKTTAKKTPVKKAAAKK